MLSGHTGTVSVIEVAVGDFTVDLQFNESHRITKDDFNYLIRDLDLPKNKAELSGCKTTTMEPYARKCQNFCV